MRLFIATPIPEPVRAAVLEWQRPLRRLIPGPGLRWANPDQMHVTLRFLGEVEEGLLAELRLRLEEACRGFAAFPLRVQGAGFFPGETRPRVFWVGLRSTLNELERLQTSVDAAVGAYAEKQEDRAFHPHLTLARVTRLSPAETRLLVERARALGDTVLGEWTADAVQLMHSELRPEGSRHTCLSRTPLHGERGLVPSPP
jgi:RNA 2',3'-cyclic 3'-phosphodiesterase